MSEKEHTTKRQSQNGKGANGKAKSVPASDEKKTTTKKSEKPEPTKTTKAKAKVQTKTQKSELTPEQLWERPGFRIEPLNSEQSKSLLDAAGSVIAQYGTRGYQVMSRDRECSHTFRGQVTEIAKCKKCHGTGREGLVHLQSRGGESAKFHEVAVAEVYKHFERRVKTVNGTKCRLTLVRMGKIAQIHAANFNPLDMKGVYLRFMYWPIEGKYATGSEVPAKGPRPKKVKEASAPAAPSPTPASASAPAPAEHPAATPTPVPSHTGEKPTEGW